jgi:hypothetical protein
MSTMATPRNRLPRGASGSAKLSQNAHLSFVVIGSPPILPPAAQQNRERDRTTQGRIEPMDLLLRRTCRRRAGCTLSNRTMRPPVIEIAHILGQNLRQMALIEHEDVVQALRPDRSHPALGDRVGPRRSERRASLGNTGTTHPPIETGAITVVAVMNEKTWRLAVPTAAFDDLLCRPLGGRMRRHVHIENLPAGMMDHEEDVECPKKDRLDAEEIARPDGRCVLHQE